MSGPLARSAHMRMKMKREKGGTTPRPSPRNALMSPANQTVGKELLFAAAVASTATLSSEFSEKEVVEPPQPQQMEWSAPSPRSLSSPVAVRSRSRSRSRSRVRAGINSLDTEGDYVVDSLAAPTSPSPRMQHSNADYPKKKMNSPSAFGFNDVPSPRQKPAMSNAANPISPTHHRSIFNSSSPRHFSTRSRKSCEFPTSPHHQYDASDVQHLRNTQREQIDLVRRQNKEAVEMHSRAKVQLSPRSESEQAFDPFAPSPLTVPDEKRSTSPFFQNDNFGAVDSGYKQNIPQAHVRSHHSRSPQLTINTQAHQHDPVQDELNVYSPNHKDGSKMMTIEGHDDNFVYPESYEDHPEADLEYHTNDDEVQDNLSGSMEQTVNSEEVQTGTPVRKKERKKKKKQKFMIENVGSADSLDKKRSDPRYAIHNNSWEEDEENVMPRSGSKVRGHSLKYNEIAATAKRYDGMDEERKKEALSPIASEVRKVVLPQRIGVSRSWDSNQVDDVRPIASSKSWDAPSESGTSSHGWRNTAKKQRNIWEEDNDDAEERSPVRQRQIVGASKSWDFSNTQSTNDNERDVKLLDKSQNVHFSNENPEPSFLQSDPFGDAPVDEGNNAAVEETFADWDGITGKVATESGEVASDKASQTKPKEELDWNKKGNNIVSTMIPVEFETPQVSEQVSDYEEDDDSIFAFEKKDEETEPEGPPPPPANPQDIFAKLSKGLKQAESNKSRALRGDSLSNADSDFSKDQSEPTSEQSKPVEKRNVAFAKDKDNTIHTYLVEESHSQVESTDEDLETEPESSIDADREQEESATPRNQTKVASPRSGNAKAASADNSLSPSRKSKNAVAKMKSVHYQSDEDTYHTNEESTAGSSFKSNRSGVTPEQQQEQAKELNLLDHVAGLAASLGGLFSSPTNAAAAAKEHDDKSLSASTDQDDNTYGQSTLPSQDNTEKSDDWFGYMEKVLFPTQEETDYPDAERSVHTESEYTESQYSESQAVSSRYTYDDYADEDEDEAYLLQQALASARAVHHIHGVEYDENQEIDVMTDVKFHVANVKLPLGLLFQEHEIGAWVSRVVPDGNGARKGVQYGDQLASINGKSAVHASIDEVAATISRTPKNTSVELTFLRYIGPLKPVPGAIIQEGFEVTDSSVNKRPPPRPPKTKPMSPAKSKSRFFTKSPPPSSKSSSSGNLSGTARSPKTTSSPTSPSKKTEDAANVDAEAGESNSRSIQKKKIKALGKMMSFKKKK